MRHFIVIYYSSILYLYLFLIDNVGGQLHSSESVTRPPWAPTGRLNQFNGFATPRPKLLPDNAQMMYASVWAAWSAWSFCSDSKRIRVRACNTVRGFRCLGPNQETEPCDPSTSPFIGLPQRPNMVSNDYDVVDPWQEDRIEALKQLYPDDSIDEKLSRLPEHEKKELLSRIGDLNSANPPTLVSHELLNRPSNEDNGAPGSTPERMFGARPKAFAVKNSQQPVKFPELIDQGDDGFKDATDITKDIDQFAKSSGESKEFIPFLEKDGESKGPKSRGEGTFVSTSPSKKKPMKTYPSTTPFPVLIEHGGEQESEEVDVPKLSEEDDLFEKMNAPQFIGKEFINDVFGSIEDLMIPKFTKTTKKTTPATTTARMVTTTTTRSTTTTTTTPPPTTTKTTTPKTTTRPITTTTTRAPITTTSYRPPLRVTPKLPMTSEDENVELVTPSMVRFREELMNLILPSTTISPSAINFFNEEMIMAQEEQEKTTTKKYKYALHDGDVTPGRTTTTTTTVAPKELPEELSLDTLHALDWMLANITKAAEESLKKVEAESSVGNELLRLDSSPEQGPSESNIKFIAKNNKLKKPRRLRNKNKKLTNVIQLHYGEIEPAKAQKKFPKFKKTMAKREKIYGIKTTNNKEPLTMYASSREAQVENKQKQEQLVQEINDIQDLMEQLDERVESRSALMEPTDPPSYPIKHEHNAPYRHRHRAAAAAVVV